MLFADVIRKKRDGGTLSAEEIRFFATGLADGSIPSEQVAAMAMAIFFRSMSFAEAAALTTAMAGSGVTLDWDADSLGGPIVDKHSTGGVGDKVSFLLAPIAAACGCFVPMISGQGLGHTGGTLDKIGSIPGYDPLPALDKFRRVVSDVGCAIIGQTAELAPADGRLYAIRDVTGTVESVPLITASILSKKIAAGNQGLAMDIKWGTGAFMPTLAEAEKLATSIIGTAQSAGLSAHALITDMNETLGLTAGNGLEIEESLRFLTNEEREPRLNEVTLALAAEMLLLTGLEYDSNAAVEKADDAVRSGKAAEIFGRMVDALGGPVDFIENYGHYLPTAGVSLPIVADETMTAGYLSRVDARSIGNAIIELGGGRQRLDDKLDLSVGFAGIAPIGSRISEEMPLAVVHARTTEEAEHARKSYLGACTITATPPDPRPVINTRMTPADVNPT